MEYCPIQVEIKHEYLRKQYGFQFLLQVWDREGKKVFEKGLTSK